MPRKNNLGDLEPPEPTQRPNKKEENNKHEEEITELINKKRELEDEVERLKSENGKLREERDYLLSLVIKLCNDINLLIRTARPPIILKTPASFLCLSYRVEMVGNEKLYIVNQNGVNCCEHHANNNSNSK